MGIGLFIALWVKRICGAILLSILATTILAIVVQAIAAIPPMLGPDGSYHPHGWGLNVPALPDSLVSAPDFATLGNVDLVGAFTADDIGIIGGIVVVFTLLLTDFFDTMGTMTAIGHEAGLLDEAGMPPNTQRILIVDSVAAAVGGAAGVSSNTSFIESARGVGEGARTGLASVVTGGLFLLAIPFAPLVEMFPSEAAVPALVLVGFLMMQQVKDIDWDDLEIAIPAFLTIALMPFIYMIRVGIGTGFLALVVIKVVRGKTAQLHPLMWVIAVLFTVYFFIDPIQQLLT